MWNFIFVILNLSASYEGYFHNVEFENKTQVKTKQTLDETLKKKHVFVVFYPKQP